MGLTGMTMWEVESDSRTKSSLKSLRILVLFSTTMKQLSFSFWLSHNQVVGTFTVAIERIVPQECDWMQWSN